MILCVPCQARHDGRKIQCVAQLSKLKMGENGNQGCGLQLHLVPYLHPVRLLVYVPD